MSIINFFTEYLKLGVDSNIVYKLEHIINNVCFNKLKEVFLKEKKNLNKILDYLYKKG